ncbi:MAG: hypothetical protein M1829_002386 [Trizodia sp. TS-e1964]|nr:MAG: hypothetical protein M1829_002386 [Trizodia sp. TS-e1964]
MSLSVVMDEPPSQDPLSLDTDSTQQQLGYLQDFCTHLEVLWNHQKGELSNLAAFVKDAQNTIESNHRQKKVDTCMEKCLSFKEDLEAGLRPLETDIISMKRSIHELQNRSESKTEGFIQFSTAEVEILTRSISKIAEKANQIDNFKADLEMVKAKLGSLEDAITLAAQNNAGVASRHAHAETRDSFIENSSQNRIAEPNSSWRKRKLADDQDEDEYTPNRKYISSAPRQSRLSTPRFSQRKTLWAGSAKNPGESQSITSKRLWSSSNNNPRLLNSQLDELLDEDELSMDFF